MRTPAIQPDSKESPSKKLRWLALFTGNSLLLSILLHVIFAVGATYFIVEHFQKKHVNFRATEPPRQHTEVEHKVELAKKNNVESAPQDLKRITTTDVSSISLPDVPETPKVSDPTPTLTAGEGDLGAGMGGGAGTGGDGSGYGSFGTNDGLVGTFYDLKQTPDGKLTDMAENAAELNGVMDMDWQSSPATQNQLRLLRRFVVSWDGSLLDGYFKAPATLTAMQLCIPPGPSENAPKAFRADAVRGRRWIAVYHAKIIPPESGRYRFIGYGDDFLVVRIDGQNVLDGSLADYKEGLDPGANVKEDVGSGPISPVVDQPYQCGTWVNMEAGLTADMQMLIGEGPGGISGFVLMIQKEGDNSPKGDYPVFQLRDSPIPDGDPLAPPSKKKMLFGVSTK